MRTYKGLDFTHLRVRIGLVFFILFVIFLKPHAPVYFITGLILSMLGELIRTWSSGHINKQAELTISGPYAYTRNPLYLGSFFIGLGLCVACYSDERPVISIITCLLFACGFLFLYLIQISKEEEYLSKKFPALFNGYRKEVPSFVPSLKSYGKKSPGRFSLIFYKKNHEYRVLAAVILIYVLLFLKYCFMA